MIDDIGVLRSKSKEMLMQVDRDARVGELYASLSNPKLPHDLAKIYMKEYRELTGIEGESGSLVFINIGAVLADQKHELRMQMLKIALFGVLFLGGVAYIRWVRKSKTPAEERLEYITDPIRIKNMTSAQFHDAVAEVQEIMSMPPDYDPYLSYNHMVEG